MKRERVHKWLIFLKKWSLAYRDVDISEHNLDALPDAEESVFSSLPNFTRTSVTNDSSSPFAGTVPCPPNLTDTDGNDDHDISDDDDEAGVSGGPQDNDIDVLETGVPCEDFLTKSSVEVLQQSFLRETSIHDPTDGPTVIPWPERASDPIDERSYGMLLASSFPVLFPCGTGDVTYKGRRVHEVSFNEALKFYITYYDENSKRYPFAECPRFMHFIQDMDERHRIQSQASVYMQKHPEDAQMTMAQLHDLAQSNDAQAYMIAKKMQRFGANITGSPAYMFQRKKELLALMEQERPATLWFTLTMPNYLWEDLQNILGTPPVRGDNESEESFLSRWKRIARDNYLKNPHLVDAFFVKKASTFLKSFLGVEGFDAIWYWYRFEWQKRGDIHLHGMARLKCDPEFSKLGKVIKDGRRALSVLQRIQQLTEIEPDHPLCNSPLFSELPSHPNDDLSIKENVVSIMDLDSDEQVQKIIQLQSLIQSGEEADKRLCTFHDYILTSVNGSDPLPTDATKKERDPPVDRTSEAHPCSTCHSSYFSGGQFSLNSNETSKAYNNLVDWCQRHRHNQGYCMRNDSCRFNFPRKIEISSRISVKDVLYLRGENKGKIRFTKLEVLSECNDSWLNKHIGVFLFTWAANCDANTLFDSDTVADYVAKYCTKTETPSEALRSVTRQVYQDQKESGVDDPKRALRKAFNKMAGQRDKTIQETVHLCLSLPIVECSHIFEIANLASTNRRINLDYESLDEAALKMNVIDCYSKRMEDISWVFPPTANELLQMEFISLCEFIVIYKCVKGKIQTRTKSSKPMVVIFSPDVKSKKDGKDFWRYAYVSLLKYKPWFYHQENVFDGEQGTGKFDTVDEAIKSKILGAFERYFRDTSLPSYNMDNPLQRAVEQIQDEGEVLMNSAPSQFSIESGCDTTFDAIMQNTLSNRNPLDDYHTTTEVHWDKQFNFTIPKYEYPPEGTDPERLNEHWEEILGRKNSFQRNEVYLCDFDLSQPGSQDQFNVVTVFLKICGLWKNSIDNTFEDTVIQPDSNCGNLMLVPGPAGAGKSFLIDCIVTEAVQRFKEKTGKDGYILILAPTGKAALQAGGYTIQSSQGLSTPVDRQDSYSLHHYKSGGLAITKLQSRLNYRGIMDETKPQMIGIVIDEYSMIPSLQMFWIHDRLVQGVVDSTEDSVFGGVPCALIGDPGQLAPVGGTGLWLSKTSNNKSLGNLAEKGHRMYMNVMTVVPLTVVRRQSGEYRDFLQRLRNGLSTYDDWSYLNRACALENFSEEKKVLFTSSETIFLYNTNVDCEKKNNEQLLLLHTPICLIESENDCEKTKTKSSEFCRKLAKKLYLAYEAKVMLLWNVDLKNGLVNGSRGIVKDFIYHDTTASPQLPYAVIIDFPEYTGPPFFVGEGKEHWVPLRPEKYEFEDSEGSHSRRQFPLSLSWGLTTWKAQGMTVRRGEKLFVVLGDSERTNGITYVGLSRNEEINDVCIGNAITLDRITVKIQSKSLRIRLIEDKRLCDLSEGTKIFYNL